MGLERLVLHHAWWCGWSASTTNNYLAIDMKYKVLSVRQPYARLLVEGIKDVENRTRKTNYRGTILIHASSKMHEVVKVLRDVPPQFYNRIEQRILTSAIDVEYENSFGAIIGSVDIIDCVQGYNSQWSIPSDWQWVCANAKVFDHPILDVKGKLGIWEWEGNIESNK